MSEAPEKLIGIDEIYMKTGIHPNTINTWYRWYDNDSIEKPSCVPHLPVYQQFEKRGKRFWREDDIKFILEFKKWVPKGRAGLMGNVSQTRKCKKERCKINPESLDRERKNKICNIGKPEN